MASLFLLMYCLFYFSLKVLEGGGGGKAPQPFPLRGPCIVVKDSNKISTHFVPNDNDCYKQGAREGGRTFSVSATRLRNQLPINLK